MIFKKLNWVFLGLLVVVAVMIIANLDCSGDMGGMCIIGVPICLFFIALPLALILIMTRLVYFAVRKEIKQNLSEFFFLIFFLVMFLCFYFYFGKNTMISTSYFEFVNGCLTKF